MEDNKNLLIIKHTELFTLDISSEIIMLPQCFFHKGLSNEMTNMGGATLRLLNMKRNFKILKMAMLNFACANCQHSCIQIEQFFLLFYK
jgi:hypothetical protein